VVGLGLMDYYGKGSTKDYSEEVYQRYLERAADFAGWLLERHYTVRLLIGDFSYDTRIKRDLLNRLKERGVKNQDGQIVDEPVSSAEELLAQLAGTDVVIATRFHKPLAGPDAQQAGHRALVPREDRVADVGSGDGGILPEYRSAGAEAAGRAIPRARTNIETVKPIIERKVEEYRSALDQQYARIFNRSGGSSMRYVAQAALEKVAERASWESLPWALI